MEECTVDVACGVFIGNHLARPKAKRVLAIQVREDNLIGGNKVVLEIPWPEGLTFKEALLEWKGVQ